jgi:hypothetical protein
VEDWTKNSAIGAGHAAQPMTPDSIETIIALIDNLSDLNDVRRIVEPDGYR